MNGRKSAFGRLMRHRSGLLGLLICAVFVAMAAGAQWIAPYSPIAADFTALRQPPSALHWFGTDEVGRDVLSRVIWGAQPSMLVGVVAVLIAMAIGLPTGLFSGYFGGIVDATIMRLTDGLLAIPSLILAVAFAAAFGASLGNAMVSIGIASAPVFIRLARAQAMSIRREQYVEAATVMGFSHIHIAARHVLPNIVPVLIVQASLSMAAAIIAEAGLSFLGLGQQPPLASWGASLNSARSFIVDSPWMSIWPGVFICLAVFGVNLLGDGLRDVLDPRDQ